MIDQTLQQFFSTIDTAIASTQTKEGVSKSAGIVRSVKDGVVHIYGLLGLRMGDVVRIEEAGVDAFVMQLEGRNAYAVQLQASLMVVEGQSVVPTGKMLGVDVSDKFLGRVVNALGAPEDGNGVLKGKKFMALERIAPGVMTREPVSEPVQTGILAIDSMIPIGRGQRELIIGDRQTGKTSVAIDAILNQKDQDMICVYVACGQRESSTANVVRKLQAQGAMDYTVIVSAGASAPAVMQFLAPYTGAAIAEYFMEQGPFREWLPFGDFGSHS